jgi:hypothetical protein
MIRGGTALGFYRRIKVTDGSIMVLSWASRSNEHQGYRFWIPSTSSLPNGFFMNHPSMVFAVYEFGSTSSEIGLRTFFRSFLIAIHIPSSVRVIGKHAFMGCYMPMSVTFDADSQLLRAA